MGHPLIGTKPRAMDERKAPCGCVAVVYFDAGLDPATGRWVQSELQLGFLPCSDEHKDLMPKILEVWHSPENLTRFENVKAVDAFITLFGELQAA